MIVASHLLARELRRRRVGRPALLASLDTASGSAYVPCELHRAPTGLLVLAAMAVSQRAGAAPGASRAST